MGWGADNPPSGPLSIVQASRGINEMRDELDERHELSTRVQELESTEGQIAALEGKGYAVVKLPACSETGVWSVVIDGEPEGVIAFPDFEDVDDECIAISGIGGLSRSEAIHLGTVLLAAAKQAEQVQP